MTKYKKHPQYSLMIGDDGTVIGPQGLIDTKKHSRTLIESGSLQGVKHPNAKLNDEIVREIRLAPKTTYGSKPWVKYGISDVTYQQVQSMKVWRHVI